MKPEKGKNFYPIFDKHGKAAYFLDQDKIHIYAWDGAPVAFVEKGAVFSFKAGHLGWYDEGWLRDREGKCVGFVESGKGGPNPPKEKPHHVPPAEKKEPPEKPSIEQLPEKPPRRAAWSALSDAELLQGTKK